MSSVVRGAWVAVSVRNVVILYLELYVDHLNRAGNALHLADPRIEKILEQRRSGCLEIERRSLLHILASDEVEFVPACDRLNDAGGVSDAMIEQCECSVMAVVQEQTVVGLYRRQKIRAETDDEPHDYGGGSEPFPAGDLIRAEKGGFAEAEVG